MKQNIVVINDNTKRLEHWKLELEDKFTVKCFSHPNYCEAEELGEEITAFIVDKFYAREDLLHSLTMKNIKEKHKKSLFFVGSSDHEEGDIIDGYDYVLPCTTISGEELTKVIESCKKA